MDKKTIILIVSCVVILITIVFFLYRRKSRIEERERLHKAIESGYQKYAYSISDLINTQIPEKYSSLQTDFNNLMKANGGMFWNDDEDLIYKLFSARTLKQLKALENKLVTEEGMNFDEYLASFLNEEELMKVKNIVSLAK